ncbi:hypothetical protein CEXT_126871 [Caerostris extrusa]|uniref:Uncharacterized protein n=1 Tax=Caerostris extrusa TaxID=172846 RepID=A0AAV4XVM1_CAEEX|nr:hypothetical protein CEXT_126871 [Caerostris extrusa]
MCANSEADLDAERREESVYYSIRERSEEVVPLITPFLQKGRYGNDFSCVARFSFRVEIAPLVVIVSSRTLGKPVPEKDSADKGSQGKKCKWPVNRSDYLCRSVIMGIKAPSFFLSESNQSLTIGSRVFLTRVNG